MIDKQLLTEMGFIKLKSESHEVWTYDWLFFVHYGGFPHCPTSRDIDGESAPLKDLFSSFIQTIKSKT